MGGLGPSHDECTVIVRGMSKVAPWQLDVAVVHCRIGNGR